MRRVLFYNWTPVGLDNAGGGGVAVYVSNILQFLQSNCKDKDILPTFLSSGYYYDSSHKIYIREELEYHGCQCFSIVNSPVVAPSYFSVSRLSSAIYNKRLLDIFDNFIKLYGPFDVIHFQSFEGISTQILSLKHKYPKIKFFHSIHDYGLFCPNVKFWKSNEQNCFVSNTGRNCKSCMSDALTLYNFHIIKAREGGATKRPIVFRIACKVCHTLNKLLANVLIHYYVRQNIRRINKYSDSELCVSKRVWEIAQEEGLNKNLLKVSYIGTKVAEQQMCHCRTNPYSDIFTILYMGYANEEKGFRRFLDCIDLLSRHVGRLQIKIAAKISGTIFSERLSSLENQVDRLTVYDGYSHSDFPEIMKDVNLGVITPMWEDNLPQVALEMIANGVPVLTGPFGGASELNEMDEFKFSTFEEMVSKLEYICYNRHLLLKYWESVRSLTTMEQHINNLLKVYFG